MKPVPSTATISVDFAQLADYPLSKDRIALFNSGLVTLSTYQRDVVYFTRTVPEHLRVDLGWGAEWMPWTKELVRVVDGRPVYDFTETDAIARLLTEAGVRPYWAYSYVPEAARRPGTDWRTMDDDNRVWIDLVTAYVAGAADRGVTIGYHEVYNEPDLRDERTAEPVFYAGDLDDYLELYRQTSRAIRRADPTARIGGPALASVSANAHWLRAFLDMVAAEDLPLDFLSFHHYGTWGLRPALTTVTEILGEYPQFREVELHLNEYNSFAIDYPQGGLQDSHLLAAAFAADLDVLLANPSLTRTSWAQFLDSGNDNYSGMITIDGRMKPLFHAYEFYQAMPVERRLVQVDGPQGVGALASSDGDRACVLLWNRSSTDATIDLATTDPQAHGTIVLLDSSEDPTAKPFHGDPVYLQRGAVALIELGGGKTAAPGRGRVVARSRYDIRDRSSAAWADVDEATGTIRFGTASDGSALLRAGVDLPADAAVEFRTSVTHADGTPAPGRLTVSDEVVGQTRTAWATLEGAPAHVFGRVEIVREASE